MSTSSSKKGFVHYFRAGIHFSERLVKNFIIQGKWIFKSRIKQERFLFNLVSLSPLLELLCLSLLLKHCENKINSHYQARAVLA